MELSSAGDRLAAIEQRLSKIETALNLSSPAKPEPKLVAMPTPAPQPFSPLPPHKRVEIVESKPGNWLGIIAIICFVLAAGFIVKLSIESGWLTPSRQIVLAALFGLNLILVGFRLLESDREYASLLPGGGIIVLYLTTFAAHGFYSLISFEAAIAVTSVISAFCIWLYVEIKHDIYALTAAIGAYSAPLILGLQTDAIFSLYYFLLCSVAFATISIWVQSRSLTLISAYLAILMSGLAGMELGQDMFVAIILALHFCVFSVGTYLYTTHHERPLDETEAWSFLPVLLLFYAMEYYFIDRIAPGLAPWVSLGFAAMLIGLYLSAKRYFPDGLGSQSLILAFATIVCFHSIYIELLPVHVRPWLFVLIMLGFAFSPLHLTSEKQKGPFYIPVLAVFAILAIEYLSMLSHLLGENDPAWILVSFAAFASIWVVLLVGEDKFIEKPNSGVTLLGAAHILAVLGFYRLTCDIGSLAVSASWLFYGVCVIILSFIRKDEVLAKSALFVLAFAAGKALLYDAASAPTIVRIFCLLLTGGVLYTSGLFMRKITDWTS